MTPREIEKLYHLKGPEGLASINPDNLALLLSYHKGRKSEVRVEGHPSKSFVDRMKKVHAGFPKEARDFLGATGVDIGIGKFFSDFDSGAADRNLTPDERDTRINPNQYGGAYKSDKNLVIATEWALKPDAKLSAAEALTRAHNGDGSLEKYWFKRKDEESVQRHETGHAFNDKLIARKTPEIGLMSDTPSFRAAYEADLAAMGGPEQAKKKGLGYFVSADALKDGNRQGRGELFAQTYADRMGGSFDVHLLQNFPNSQRWMREFKEGFASASKAGPRQMAEFVSDFGNNHQLDLEARNANDLAARPDSRNFTALKRMTPTERQASEAPASKSSNNAAPSPKTPPKLVTTFAAP